MRIWEDKVDLGTDAVTRVFAVLAQRGGGKTYTAKKIAEGFLAEGTQIVAIDPVGVWWGLRLKSDGKTPAFEVPIFGGLRSDLGDLSESSGSTIARALVESSSSAIVDVSMFSKAAFRRFMTDFLETFLHLKKSQRSPVHLFFEEAQELAPQNNIKGQERMLGAAESLVKLGRNFGIGSTIVSQRPQSVNKNLLNQADVLIALRTTGPHERGAIEAWVRENEASNLDRSLLAQIASLKTGDAIVWSPSWLDVYFKTRILPIQTLDSSATPTKGGMRASEWMFNAQRRADGIARATEG